MSVKLKEAVYIVDQPSSSIIFSNVHFTNIISQTAIFVRQFTESITSFQIESVVFDNCSSNQSFLCFNISLMTSNLLLSRSVIQNTLSNRCDVYFGSIQTNNKTHELILTNWSFINNTCKSLYGGGIGTLFDGIESLIFDKCCFKNNTSKQDLSKSRTAENEASYYNGDGGGIQLGYSCSLSDFDVAFKFCKFENNKADRHGGAIAIQTLRTVSIVNCTFNNNVANCIHQSSSSLLTTDYFNLKKDGRGGAIYINPDFLNECKSLSSFMISVDIENCSFVSNNAFDGYAIYVEGDNSNDTNFSI